MKRVDSIDQPAYLWASGLLILGGLSLPFYLAITLLVPLSSVYQALPTAVLIDQLPFWETISRLPGPRLETGLEVLAITLPCLGMTFTTYLLAIWVGRNAPPTRLVAAIIVAFMGIFSLIALLALPNLASDDIYWYIKQARSFNVYHANPYGPPPTPLPGDPHVLITGWLRRSSPYGPAWTFLGIIWGKIAGERVIDNLLFFRAGLIALNLANAGMIWMILGRLTPDLRLAGLISYAWNPIVVLESAFHLDTAMLFFVLLGVFCILSNRPWAAIMGLTLSVLVKFITAPLLLIYLFYLWRTRSFRYAFAAGILAGMIVALVFLPFWTGWEMLWVLAREPRSTPGSLFSGKRLLLIPGFIALTLWLGWRGRTTITGLLSAWEIALIWFGLFLMPNHYPWYLLTTIGIISLAPAGRARPLTLAILLASLLTNITGQVVKPFFEVSIWVLRLTWWGPTLLAAVWVALTYLPDIRSRVYRQNPAAQSV